MSAAGFTPIQLYRTTTASAVPSAGNLADGELAINLTDEALYFKNAAGVVTLLADSSGALGSVTSVNASGGTTGLTFSGGPITSSGTLTLGGTLAVANGGTGVTTSTGTGSVVLSNSPTLVTPTLGVASATSIATGKGTVGSVAYGFTANTNTGMWSPSADAIAFSTAGSERLRVTSAGNVGIGLTSPQLSLSIGNGGGANPATSGSTQSAGGIARIGSSGVATLDIGTTSAGSAWLQATNVTDLATNYSLLLNPNGGNVGIGTTSPAQKLNVIGDIQLSRSTTASDAAINFGSNNNNYIYSGNSSNIMAFQVNATERMRIDSSGNVGIGTSAPAQKLHVATTAAPSGTTQSFLRLTGDATFGADFGGGLIQGVGPIATISTVNSGTATERMRIDSSGNVGIGITSPTGMLDVNGAIVGRSTLSLNDAVNYNGSSVFFIRSRLNGGTVQIGTETTGGTLYYPITINGTSNFMSFSNQAGEAMRIDSSGNVGIGTASPSRRLTVSATGTDARMNIVDSDTAFATATALTEYWGSDGRGAFTGLNGGVYSIFTDVGVPMNFLTAGTERMRIDSSGNVGIGTSSPGYLLHGVQNGNAQFWVAATNVGSNSAGIGFENQGQRNWQIWADRTNDALQFGNNSRATTNMVINSSGNVGIGTSSPGKKLDVVGQFRISGAAASGYALAEYGTSATATNNWHVGSEGDGTFRWYNGTLGAGTERMRITSAGLVGIGTTSPSAAARLDVSSTTSGFLPPRMTTAQRDAISSPPNGLMLYNTSTDKLQVRAAGAWVDLH